MCFLKKTKPKKQKERKKSILFSLKLSCSNNSILLHFIKKVIFLIKYLTCLLVFSKSILKHAVTLFLPSVYCWDFCPPLEQDSKSSWKLLYAWGIGDQKKYKVPQILVIFRFKVLRPFLVLYIKYLSAYLTLGLWVVPLTSMVWVLQCSSEWGTLHLLPHFLSLLDEDYWYMLCAFWLISTVRTEVIISPPSPSHFFLE